MKLFKHGLPGIGITGKTGKQGKTGNGIYFGTLDSFFTFIGDDVLNDVSIDYDDSDYNITYANNELRLSPLYNTGDILYVLNNNSQNSSVSYMVEITDDLTTCTLDYFIEHIKTNKPFTKKFSIDDTNYILPINIVSNDSSALYNANEKHNNALVSITGVKEKLANTPTVISLNSNNLTDINLDASIKLQYDDIPLRVNSDSSRIKYIHNGMSLNVFNYGLSDSSCKLLNLIAENTTLHNLDIICQENKDLNINADTLLYINNLYINNGNYGNLEAYNTIYDPSIKLDDNGNCYTLSEDDYDSSTWSFTINTSSFLWNNQESMDNYHFGYIHMYWNYNDLNYIETLNTNYYQPNYIRGYNREDTDTSVRKIKVDSDGNYIRNWNDPSYVSITNMYIKLLLINTTDLYTLNDVSTKLNESVNEVEFNEALNVSGIIKTEILKTYAEYNYIKLHDGKLYKQYIDSDRLDVLYDSDLVTIIDNASSYIDTSFYSYIEYVNDPSILTVSLSKQDNNAMQYRHHKILQWIQTPNGLKYYSKPTHVDYNWDDNTFNINTNWTPIYNPGFTDSSTTGDNNIFDISFGASKIYVAINTSTQLDNDYINDISIYENSSLLKSTISNKITLATTKFNNGYTNYSSLLKDTTLLTKLSQGQNLSVASEYVYYTIKYSINNEKINTHVVNYIRPINGFNDYRTFPIITFKNYNDPESIEQLNKSENGILCNLLLMFVGINIDKFSNSDWGKMGNDIINPILYLELNLPTIDDCIHKLTGDTNNYIISYSLLKPTVDIFNSTAKELEDSNNIKLPASGTTYGFTINEASSGMYYLRILIESENPIPGYILNLLIYVKSMYITANILFNLAGYNITYISPFTDGKFSGSSTIFYKANPINIAFAPISYIASYNQTIHKITEINNNWQGISDEVDITIKPYKLDDIENSYQTYTLSAEGVNWNAIKYKYRYLQDNIYDLLIFTYNINYIKNLISDNYYSTNYLVDDVDDISYSYLQLVFNSNLLNPELIDDLYSFIFNDEIYLASKYGLFGNNTAVFIKLESTMSLRDSTLISSIKAWNELYETSYHYESDNPYKGHLSTYGNGYLYLPNYADEGQYNTLNLNSLSDILMVGNDYFFDTKNNELYVTDVTEPAKINEYTPSKLFRDLIYLILWCYPKYKTETGLLLIYQYIFDNAKTSSNRLNDTKMPYNLCYNIKPRVMFNDEVLYNVALMLRRPSVGTENKYALLASDLCLPTDTIEELSNPLNDMN